MGFTYYKKDGKIIEEKEVEKLFINYAKTKSMPNYPELKRLFDKILNTNEILSRNEKRLLTKLKKPVLEKIKEE